MNPIEQAFSECRSRTELMRTLQELKKAGHDVVEVNKAFNKFNKALLKKPVEIKRFHLTAMPEIPTQEYASIPFQVKQLGQPLINFDGDMVII